MWNVWKQSDWLDRIGYLLTVGLILIMPWWALLGLLVLEGITLLAAHRHLN